MRASRLQPCSALAWLREEDVVVSKVKDGPGGWPWTGACALLCDRMAGVDTPPCVRWSQSCIGTGRQLPPFVLLGKLPCLLPALPLGSRAFGLPKGNAGTLLHRPPTATARTNGLCHLLPSSPCSSCTCEGPILQPCGPHVLPFACPTQLTLQTCRPALRRTGLGDVACARVSGVLVLAAAAPYPSVDISV